MSKERTQIDRGDSMSKHLLTNFIVKVSEVMMYDFEIKMRKMIIDLLNPSIEKMSKDREIQANMIRS